VRERIFGATTYLKVYLQAELNIARPYVHCAADDPEGVAPEPCFRPAELRRVRQVERLGAELDAHPLGVTKVFGEREIQVLLLVTG
jgi:hypothetical protein